ncbi:Uncharacterized protein TCM_005357 [Theobroma cacao]|uniref:Uncharacterized protein n=1 Tax=Theobroma cacao TaxID=3641 RepID=A0A061E142_THECC|nr:Uncharacterized protein TCM_005357 [Theobroma cacao]
MSLINIHVLRPSECGCLIGVVFFMHHCDSAVLVERYSTDLCMDDVGKDYVKHLSFELRRLFDDDLCFNA